MTHTTLYRFYNANERLLYVGITHRLNERLASHRKEKPWDQVARVTLVHYPTRQDAVDAERAAILVEQPIWNVIYNTQRAVSPTSRHAKSWRDLAREEWPNAEWIAGVGRYATVAYCRVVTVVLHETIDEAEKAWDFLRSGCGGRCYNDHWVHNLASGLAYTDGRVRLPLAAESDGRSGP